MKRFWLIAVIAVSSCSGGQVSGTSNSPSAVLPASRVHAAATTTSSSACVGSAIDAGSNSLYDAMGTSTSDMWAIEFAGAQDSNPTQALAHFENGVQVGSYTVPQDASTVKYAAVDRIRILNGTPWAIGTYETTTGTTVNYAAEFNGTSLVAYPYSTAYQAIDIGGSASTGLYLAATTTPVNSSAKLVILKFNGSEFVPLATYLYGDVGVNDMLVFGNDVYVMLTHGPYSAELAHWNGSSFQIAQMQYDNEGGNGVEITGTSPADMWAVTATSIWHDDGNWQPYLYQSPSQNSPYFDGIVEFDSRYVVVPNTVEVSGTNGEVGGLVYNGVDRFLPMGMTPPSNDTTSPTLLYVNGVPNTTAFYATYVLTNDTFGAALFTCPASPPA